MLKTDLSAWIGETQTTEGRLGEDVAAMLHATLADSDAPPPARGAVAPPLWHWAAFTPKAPMARLSDDGHPERGGFLPPINLPRRMWAGGEVRFVKPIRVAAPLRQISTITAVEEKSPAMTFVTLEHAVHEEEEDAPAITETQNIVYLQIPERFTPPKPRAVPAAADRVFSRPAPITAAHLFRYSAATFNAHRIHYDIDYAKTVEKYPGLVVHGPLQATLLLAAAVAHTGRTPARFAYRGVHPVFLGDDLHLNGFDESAGTMALCTGVAETHQGLSATVTWRDEE